MAWEAEVIARASIAVVPDDPGGDGLTMEEGWEVAARVDRYLVGTPVHLQNQVHTLMRFLEHGTILMGSLTRFTAMTPVQAHRFLMQLRDWGAKGRLAYRAIRDFVYLGWYQSDTTWVELGYPGPMFADQRMGRIGRVSSRYDHLLAKQGDVPKGVDG
jgi:hypothetical protein